MDICAYKFYNLSMHKKTLLSLLSLVAFLSACTLPFPNRSSTTSEQGKSESQITSSEQIVSSSSQTSISSEKPSSSSESSSEEKSSSSSQQPSSSSSSSSSSAQGSTSEINSETSDATETTISSLISANKGKSNTSTLYRITGTAQWPKNTKYGNFDLLDSTGYIYVYGCSANKSSITKASSTYSFSNDQSFRSTGIMPGDTVTMEGLFVWYSYSSSYGVAEFQGYVTSVIHNKQSTITPVSYTASETYSGNYYDSISTTQTGQTLLASLHNLMDTTHSNYVSYGSLDTHFKSSDKSGSSVKCFYSGSTTSKYNKEHVWPQSLSGTSQNQLYGEDHGGSDIHHIRPTISDYNSKRGNAMFGPIFGDLTSVGKISYSGGGYDYYTGNVFEPADSIKGDVARIIMYMYMHYSSQITGGNSQTFYGEMHINYVMGAAEADSGKLLRKWNAEDPVSQDEITRNNYAFSVQGNRNPFIDHPSYADKIWG